MDWQSYGFRKVISSTIYQVVHRAIPLRQLDITISGWIPSGIKAEPRKAVHQVTICLIGSPNLTIWVVETIKKYGWFDCVLMIAVLSD